MSENVIELKFRSPQMAEDDLLSFIACKSCRNKTFTLIQDQNSSFPLMKCACCGQAMGRMGWYHDDDDSGDSTA